jgi:thiol-disulfide isomerase/thioredoxin
MEHLSRTRFEHLQAVFLLVGLLCTAVTCKPAETPIPKQFVQDNVEQAKNEARRFGRPMFVDVWADWCEPCKEMRPVFSAPQIAALRDRFVWLSIDADKPENQDFLKKHPHNGLPTLWVFDAHDQIVLEWNHSVSAPTLEKLLKTSASIAASRDRTPTQVAAQWAETFLAIEQEAKGDERGACAKELTDAAIASRHPELALPVLEEQAARNPVYFMPNHQQAKVYLALNRVDDAKHAVERAEAKVHGWRALEVHVLAADIAARRGDADGERAALQRALAAGAEGGRTPASDLLYAKVRARLEAR